LHQQLKSLDTYKFAVLVHLVSSMLTLEATTIREKQFPLFDFRYHQWNTAIHRAWLALPQNGNKFPITEESAIHYLLLMIPRLNAYWSKQGESEKIITWSTRLLQLIKDTTYQIDSLEEDSISLIIDILENYIDKQDHEFAKKYLDILEQEINASKNPEKFMSEFLFYKGNYFLGKGEPEKAIEIFKENMKCIGDGEGGSLQKGKVLGNIGSAYLQLQMYDEGIDYLQKAIDIAKDNEDAIGYAIRLGNLGAAYLAKSDHILNNAEGLLEESYGILKKSNHFLSIARKAMNLGSINYRTGKINLGKAYFDEAIRIYSLINHPELNQAKKALSLYEGKIDIPSPLPPNIITYLSVDALLGDKIAEAKVFPTINFLSSHPEINNELALFSQRLKLIFKGERNEEILSKDLPKEFEYSILSILKIIENPEMSDLANRFGNLVIGIKLGDKNAIEYGKNLIEYIESGSVTDDFHTIELARCLQHILNGEKDVDIIVGDLKDDFQKMTVLNSLAYSNYLLSDSEE
jgi:tetratricopeptide (TPR) repeat protein